MKTFRTYLSENFDLSKWEEKIINNDGSIEDLHDHYETIKKINDKGGKVYRLVFLNDPKQLKKNLGIHWVADLNYLHSDLLYDNLADAADEDHQFPFLITATIEKNQVDIKNSLDEFAQLPDEGEVQLKKTPKTFTIKKFRK